MSHFAKAALSCLFVIAASQAVFAGDTAATTASAPADTSPIFDIPKLDSIKIDGDAADWGDSGLRVGPLLTLEG